MSRSLARGVAFLVVATAATVVVRPARVSRAHCTASLSAAGPWAQAAGGHNETLAQIRGAGQQLVSGVLRALEDPQPVADPLQARPCVLSPTYNTLHALC